MTFEPERKKAKTDHEDDSSTVVEDRVKELQDKILALREEYPELTCIDQNRLHSCLDETFVKYKSEQNERHCPIYKLPSEILQKCFEFVDDGSYLFTATVSKKFHETYMARFALRKGEKVTSYRYGACSTSLAKYCVETLCKTQDEKDQIFIAGTGNGNVEILEYALDEGHDLSPIINCFALEDILFIKHYIDRTLPRPSNNMHVKDFFFRKGFLELYMVKKLLESPSLVILISRIMNDGFLKEQAAKESIDETTMPKLQKAFEIMFDNQDEFHFAPNGRSQKTALRKLEDEWDTVFLGKSLKYLKEELGSFAVTVERRSTDHAPPIVSNEAHDINQQNFSKVVKTVGKLHSFVTNPRILQEDLRNEILVHANDLLKIHTLLEKIECHGVFTKGKYPFTAKKELILARNQRDNWCEMCPSIAMSILRHGYSVDLRAAE